MKHRNTLFSIFSLTLCALGVWIVIFFNVDPNKSDKMVYIAYLSSLFLWLSGLHTFVEYLIRICHSKESVSSSLINAGRHGMMLALTLTLLLTLQFLHILNILDAVIIATIIATTELYFNRLSRKQLLKTKISAYQEKTERG